MVNRKKFKSQSSKFKIWRAEINLKFIGNLLTIASLAFLVLIFAPVVGKEAEYSGKTAFVKVSKLVGVKNPEEKVFNPAPVNTSFSIVIPKIQAKAAIIANVDPSDQKAYLSALKKGVAQARGTSLPGQGGNVYLFAHSTDAFYNVGYYNAVFYLIGKLANSDEIEIYYNNKEYIYRVFDKKVVNPEDSQYFYKIADGETLTLQTCYPPGTTLKRLVVLAKLVN